MTIAARLVAFTFGVWHLSPLISVAVGLNHDDSLMRSGHACSLKTPIGFALLPASKARIALTVLAPESQTLIASIFLRLRLVFYDAPLRWWRQSSVQRDG